MALLFINAPALNDWAAEVVGSVWEEGSYKNEAKARRENVKYGGCHDPS